ncbi:MAG: hypothetical protein KatS3mg030_068 [Saprospiraceae bacterium]|nr:MAG: hypothetical protein KatS3mg030_068 [Saprospiraceae bacterium]
MGRVLFCFMLLTACHGTPVSEPETGAAAAVDAVPFSLDELQRRTFLYFWETTDSTTNWQVHDRWPTRAFSSIAATGFGLSAYLVGIERGYITRAQGADRVLKTLKVLAELPQGPEAEGVSGYKGFFYHFLTLDRSLRFKQVELSSIDTGLLMAGVLSAMTYFDGDDPVERQIRSLADFLYRRVEWDWMLKPNGRMSMGWHPETGFIENDWHGYNEAMILLIMALGSPTHPIPAESWQKWCETYVWDEFQGFENVQFDPLFGHQYSHIWIDFRGIQDDYMRSKGIDYFENSRRATLSNRAYCLANPMGWNGYGEHCWGLTACDGPAAEKRTFRGRQVEFWTYRARGACSFQIVDDGTIAPTAAGGSIPFAPEVCIPALEYMWNTFYHQLVGPYGFRDAFNLSYTFGEGNEKGWFDVDYIGIDQGPIVLQIENYRTGFLWKLMKKNPYIVAGLAKAGFK